METIKLSKRIDAVEAEHKEHRKTINQFKRSIWEITQIALGHKQDVEKLSHRIGDTEDRFNKIEGVVTWTMRGVIGLFLTTLVAAVFKYIFGV